MNSKILCTYIFLSPEISGYIIIQIVFFCIFFLRTNSLGNISNIGNDTYNNIEKILKYYIDNGYLPSLGIVSLIPKMTSNTTPSGVANCSSIHSSPYDAYCAFDGDVWSSWIGKKQDGTEEYVGYQFNSSVIVKSIKFLAVSGRTAFVRLVASNDNSEWDELLGSYSVNNYTDYTIVNINNENRYKYYRLYVTRGTSPEAGLAELQLYGYE